MERQQTQISTLHISLTQLEPDQTRTAIVHSFVSMLSFADYTGDLLAETATQ